MDPHKVNDGFGDAVDKLMMTADIENRGCQLVSSPPSASSETDHITEMQRLKTLLASPPGGVPVDMTGADPLVRYGSQHGKHVSAESPGAAGSGNRGGVEFLAKQLMHGKGSGAASPAQPNLSNRSDMSSALLKSGEGANVLKHAEAVIEYQRERISALESAVEKFNQALAHTNNMHKNELQRQMDENVALRQEMQKVITEFEVLSQRYQIDMSETEQLKKKVNIFTHDLAKREDELARLQEQMHQLPLDNNELKAKNRMLSKEIDRLNREIRGLNVLDAKINSKPATAAVAGTTMACAAQHEKLKASTKCIAQLENDLQSYKRLTESQSMDIKRLHHQLDKLQKEAKPNNYLLAAQRQMLQIRSVFLQLAKQSTQPKPDAAPISVDEDLNNRSLYAAYNMKASAEFREMYDKLLDVVNRNMSRHVIEGGFYTMPVFYSCDSVNEQLHVKVEESLLIFSREDENQLTEVLRIPLSMVLGVKKKADAKEFYIHTNDSAVHILRSDSRDIYNRLYYALQYAGFISEQVRFSIFSKVDLNWVPTDCSWPLNSAVVVATESGYKGPPPMNMEHVRRALAEVYVLTDPTERLLTIDQNSNSLVVSGPQMSATPFIVPCDGAMAVRLCDPAHVDCDEFTPADPPVATLANGTPTTSYFVNSGHVFAFVAVGNRILFVKGATADDERRLLSLLRKGVYKRPIESSEYLAETPARITSRKSTHLDHPISLSAPSFIIRSRDTMELPTSMAETVAPKLYDFVDGKLVLYTQQEEHTVLEKDNGSYRVNADTREVALLSGSLETYVLSFRTDEELREFTSKLEAQGFAQPNVVEVHQQVCIVTAGCLRLYKDAQDAPIVTFDNQDTEVDVNEERREIKITNAKDESVKMTIDCVSPAEFRRWKFALGLAGFIKGIIRARTGDALKKYIFPIKIFDDEIQSERRAFQVEPGRICLYVNPTIATPFLVFDKSKSALELFDHERRLRLYVNRNTKMEERFDFGLAMLTDYQLLKTALRENGYVTEPVKGKVTRYHFVISKPGLISVHRTKFDADPQLVLERKLYTAEVTNMCIKFVTKGDTGKTITILFKKEFNFKRWLMALKVAGYLPLTPETVPVLYLPTIIYGHICAEIPALLKGHLK
ncbi:hypothetical protein, conserved [Babesia bigemina]|uniref:Uncharacterized protein n=1 Tax=Babesia bigemina TaxID=5866 RepID=A0A061DC02_BABBI|nr:hypothetical protein, conserved [Babesia bigemina]CDR96429.1 hypothetical protein, conserved [Babesia bigemina]|eukprot:XP_012768615.1 hypothetical protein, conserved [Babesia bigemina]